MSNFAQKDYNTKIGNSDVTIAEGGAFITAVANILGKFGLQTTPEDVADRYDELNAWYNWSLPSFLNDEIAPIEIAPGAPTSNDSIVSFTYESKLTGEQVTGYACVDDYTKGTIIDSFDGEIRSWDVYGGPVSHATYSRDSLPISLLHVPIEPQTYSIEGKQKGYMTEADALARTNYAVTFTPGTYYADYDTETTVYLMPVQDQKGYWINKNGDETIGVSEKAPSETPVETSTTNDTAATPVDEEDTSVPVKVIPADPLKWQKSYKPNLGMVEYRTTKSLIVHDLAGNGDDKPLPLGALVPVAGYFADKDGNKYARTVKSVGDDAWYGVPIEFITKNNDNDDNDINDTIDNIIADDLKNKQVIRVAAKTAGTLTRLNPFSYIKNKETK